MLVLLCEDAVNIVHFDNDVHRYGHGWPQPE